MKTKHTPGPWTVEVGQTETCIESKYQTIALDVSNCDADLIAAAPELLKALQDIVDLQGKATNGLPLSENEMREWAVANVIARAAIAKAEGRHE